MSTSAEEAWRDFSGGMSTEEFPAAWKSFLAGWEAHERKHIEEHKETLIAWQEQQEKLQGSYE